MSAPIILAPLEVVDYQPGVCNIGRAEIGRRRRAGWLGAVVTVVVFGLLLLVATPHWTRLVLVFPAAISATGFIQARLRFCAGFGSQGVYNFGELGTVQAVADSEARARDRRRSTQIGLASLAVGIVVGVAAMLLPLR